jgi:ribonuclease HI
MAIKRAPKKTKWYVVWIGRSPGVYPSWEKCKEQVEGFNGSKYKAFDTLMEAKQALEEGPPVRSRAGKKAREEGDLGETEEGERGPITPSICVDAACDMTTGVMEYQGVDTQTGARFFHMGPFKDSTNNIGEFLAVVHALSWMRQKGLSMPIYTDSKTALSWYRHKHAKTQAPRTQANANVFELIRRAEHWLRYNDTSTDRVLKWETKKWGEIPADFGRK